MAVETLKHAWQSLRLIDTPSILRRLAGLGEFSDTQFAWAVSADEKQHLQKIARDIRNQAPPALVVHGVLPRSGTNLAANILALHPAIHAFPRSMWEIPTLATAPASVAWRHEWLARFPENEPIVSQFEPLCWIANGMMRSLQAHAPEKHLLVKSPHMRHVSLFEAIYPDDQLVMVMRDGRDVIASAKGTFKDRLIAKSPKQLAREWRQATELALDLAAGDNPRGILWRFEELVADPRSVLERDLPKIGLDPKDYPFDKLNNLPVFGSSTDKREGNDRWNPVEKNTNFNPVGRGKSLSPRLLSMFEREAGSVLAKAGYS